MRTLTIDFETYFDDSYGLKGMTTEAYIRDPRFEVLLMAVHDSDKGGSFYVCGATIREYLHAQDWKNTAILCHHAHFDGLVLSHVYGVKPALWLDTLSMSKLLLADIVLKEHAQKMKKGPHALDTLSSYFNLNPKTVPYDLFKGVHYVDLSPQVVRALGEGACHDVDLTRIIFARMLPHLPQEELHIIDMTVRMFTEPALKGDEPTLRALQQEEWQRKGDQLIALNVTPKQLGSAKQFTALLEAEGIEVATKQGTNGPIPAFAKTDAFMQELVTHPNSRVAALVQAKLDLSSKINETRSGRLADMASRGDMTVYLHYCGAHTTRWSGGDKVNFQNFPRDGKIRRTLSAPDGFMLAVCDLSQIECRVLSYVAGQQDILDAFASGRDLYSEGASRFYGRPINKKDNPTERHLGKVLELACGYGQGAKKFKATCAAGALGGPPIHLSDAEAKSAVDTYRRAHPGVTSYWRQADTVLSHLAYAGPDECFHWGPMRVYKGRIVLPNDTELRYDLFFKEYVDAEGSIREGWFRKTYTGPAKMWGGVLTENVVQALSRVVLSQAMLRIKEQTDLCPIVGVRPLLCTHDEVVYLIPDVGTDGWYQLIEHHMKETPDWLPGIPLDAEGGVYKVYEK